MTLLERVKELLIERKMSFTDLAEQMGASRSSLYQSLQAESVRYSTLKKIAETLSVELYSLSTHGNLDRMEFLEDEILILQAEWNRMGLYLLKLKNNKMTISEIEYYFNTVANSLTFWSKRIHTLDEIAVFHHLQEPEPPTETK